MPSSQRQRGRMDQRVTLRRKPTAKSSGSGADIAQEPVEIATVWARVEVATGGRTEAQIGDVLATITVYSVEIDYMAGLDETIDILWGTRTLDVIDVQDLGPRPRYITLLAEERR